MARLIFLAVFLAIFWHAEAGFFSNWFSGGGGGKDPNANSFSADTKVKRDPNTKAVFFGMRHGNRNPDKFVKEHEGKWGQEGALELTKWGKRQAYSFGKQLRGYLNGYIDKNYVPSEAKFYSSSANRCQMTLQSALAGLYTPEGIADWNNGLDWSPVPYTIDDPIVRMYSVKCPKSDKVWDPVSNDKLPELKEEMAHKKALLDYMAKNTGWEPTLSNAAEIADNLLEIKLYGATVPSWIEKPTLPGYTKEKLVQEYLEFAESHQIACAKNGPCQRMMGCYWLSTILDNLKNLKAGKKSPKLFGYAGHTETTMALMMLVGYDIPELQTTAGFVLEVRDKPTWSIRLLFHDPIGTDSHKLEPAKLQPALKSLADANGWIDLDKFINYATPKACPDWKAECGLPACAV